MSQSERHVKYGPKGPPPPPPPPPPLPKLPAYSHQKLFKKCKSATFQLDGATYTIGTQPLRWSSNKIRSNGRKREGKGSVVAHQPPATSHEPPTTYLSTMALVGPDIDENLETR